MQTDAPKINPPKRKRRWLQFSLRSLLIFTTICAMACGWLAKRIEMKRKEREAFCHFAPGVAYDYQIDSSSERKIDRNAEPPGPKWLRQVLGDNFFGKVVRVDIQGGHKIGQQITDADMKFLADLPDLESVDFWHQPVTDKGVAYIATLPQLRTLLLDGTGITDVGVERLKELTELQTLGLSSTQISDAGLVSLKGLTELEALYLSNTHISDAGLMNIHDNEPLVQFVVETDENRR